ncbi:hypothetical protein C3K47_10605 [Solitalea longa]|uniref:DUF1569 domain-containing protein n=1 Tax=Solitalea longa TaxID=2079460 RepID=A0A2S5A0T5_9SPHI|nr:DUF1569 domain-containing protein [Solitalea longa]POY36201.1 hypothetical protein C3K47_10605 [Solitalea longa]
MEKNLFNNETAEKIIERVKQLGAESSGLWGKMTAEEMLMHCNSCNREILEGSRGTQKTSLKQYLLRILALYLAPNFKKGIKSEDHHIIGHKINNLNFEEIKDEFIDLIHQFPLNKKELTLSHPAFGNISTKQWGIAAYKHMDHHLRQFGV